MSPTRPKPSGVTSRLAQPRVERAEAAELSRKSAEPAVASNGVAWLPVPAWKKTAWLWHGFSTRQGGESRVYCAGDAPAELNLGFTAEDDRQIVARNRRLLAAAVTGDEFTPLLTARQFHSGLVTVLHAKDAHRTQPPKADGMITNEPGILLGIQTADCIPVLVADRKRRVVAAFHAGWRGTVKRIVQTGVGVMRLEFGSEPKDLVAAIGPGIGPCCYSVGEEVCAEFESQFAYSQELFREILASAPLLTKHPISQQTPGRAPSGPSLRLDLVEANRRQLLAAGLKASAIEIVGGCSSCQPELFFSHRAEKGHAGRMLAVIGIKPL